MPETKNNEDRENTSPVIGILGQVSKNFNCPYWKKSRIDLCFKQWNKDEETYLCYVAASYVKYLECAGARQEFLFIVE